MYEYPIYLVGFIKILYSVLLIFASKADFYLRKYGMNK